MRPDRSEGCPFLIQVKSVGSGKVGGSCRRSTGTLTSCPSWSFTMKLSCKFGGPEGYLIIMYAQFHIISII